MGEGIRKRSRWTFSIAGILRLDGLTNGAIYALLALATVLVFAVTRVIFIPQGEFVAYGALTLAMLQTGKVPGTIWLLLLLAALAAAALDAGGIGWRRHRNAVHRRVGLQGAAHAPARSRRWPRRRARAARIRPGRAGAAVGCIVTPFGPLVYRLAYQPLADASVLVLLIVSVGVHFALTGPGLLFFGAEGFATSRWRRARSSGALHVTARR